MATDGVKIIDGDLAHDTYEYIMELYDNGASAEIIKKERIKDMQSYPETAARTSMRLARGKLNIPEKYDTIG